jgi:hypothetical protein
LQGVITPPEKYGHNVAQHLTFFKIKLGTLGCHNKVQVLDKGYNPESNIFGVVEVLEFLIQNLCQNWL